MASMVKSVEFIEYTLTGTSASIDLSKNQNYENCVPFMTLHGCSDYMDSHCTDIYFSGTTTSGVINFQRDETRSCSLYIKCYVVEFDPNEVKVQHGTFTATPTTTAYNTPSSFTQNRTAGVCYWKSTDSGQRWDRHLVRFRVLSNGTQIDVYRNESTGTVTGHYFLFEDITTNNDHFRTNHVENSFTGTAAHSRPPAGWRDLTKTFAIGYYACSDGGTSYNDRQTVRIFSYFKSWWRIDRSYGSGTIWWALQFINFTDESKIFIMDQRERSLSSGTTVSTQPLKRTCSLNTSCIISSTPMGICRGNSTSTSQIDSLWMSMKLNSSTESQFQRNSDGGGNTSYMGYSVIDWAGISIDTGTNSDPLDPDITFVKSVENFRLEIEGYWDSYDLTKGQDVSNCALFVSTRGQNCSTEIREKMGVGWIREPGIVVVHRNDAGGQLIADISVVEFYPDQVKVQQGEWQHWSTSTETATVSGVVSLDKAFILSSWEANDATRWDRLAVRSRFTATDTVEFYRQDAGNMVEGVFFVIEDLADNFRVEHFLSSFTGTSKVFYPSNYNYYYGTLPIASYAVSTGTYYVDRGTARVYMTTCGGRLVVNRQGGYDTMYTAEQHVRFLDMRKHTQWVTPTLDTSTTVKTDNVTSVFDGHENALTVFNAMQNNVGRGTGTGSDDNRGVFHNYRLINNDADIEISREATVGISLYPSKGGVIDWIGYSNPLADEKQQLTYSLGIKSLVRSVEKFKTTSSTSSIQMYYMTKGQRGENCVPFASNRTGSNDAYMSRILRNYYVDEINNKIISAADGGPSGGNLDEIVYLVEFDPRQVKVQKIFKCMSGTSVNVAIPEEVNLDKTFMWFTYGSTAWSKQWRSNLVRGKFNSSTELNFYRYTSATSIELVIYLIECLQDQWQVRRVDSGSATGTNFDNYVSFVIPGNSNRFIQGSYSNNTGAYYCDRTTMRLYPLQAHGFRFNKYHSYDTIIDRHIEVLEFNPKYNIYSEGHWTDSDGSTTSETKSTGSETVLDLNRAMVCPTIVDDINRQNGTGGDDVGSVTVSFELTDGSTVTCSKYAKGDWTYGWFQWVEWPPYKTHYFEGVVTEKGNPIVRQVACFRADTNEMMDFTTSTSGTGYYRLETTYSGTHYIVCQDDYALVDYNDLVLGKMEPYPITSGTVWGDGYDGR